MMHRPESPQGGVEFDLPSLEREVRQEPAYDQNGHAARTLIRLADLRVVLLVMRAGSHIAEHEAYETATVHVLSGELRLGLGERAVDLRAGHLFTVPARMRHDVRALTDNAFLLTLGWPGEGSKASLQ
jgi:quercetin dioxygenase-like cupin family protein